MLFESNQAQNELEAYLLGFLYADGSITGKVKDKYYLLTIAQSYSHKEFLQEICDIFNFYLKKDYKLKEDKKRHAYKLVIGNVEMISNLIRLGITPLKTYENSDFVFQNVPDNLKMHFVRGFFDGDGTVGFNKNGGSFFGFVSYNESIIIAIKEYLFSYLGKGSLKKEYSKKNDSHYYRYVSCGNIVVKHLGELLYKDANYYMKSKYDIFQKVAPQEKTNLYTGLRKNHNRFVVEINYDNKHHYLGSFKTIKEAITAYNKEALLHNKPIQEYKGEYMYVHEEGKQQ